MGDIPMMVRSGRCHLAGLSPRELVARKEEASEMGGYFICNGNERAVRLLQVGPLPLPVFVSGCGLWVFLLGLARAV